MMFALLRLLMTRSGRDYLFARPATGVGRWQAFWCRLRGHAGVEWYDVGGIEPDMHCRECGDDLG